MRFNQLPIGAIFKHPMNDMKFVKFANAIPRIAPNTQPPNSFCIDRMHYFSLGANSPVEVVRLPSDCDNELQIV